MLRHSLKLGATTGLVALFGAPAALFAQECAENGNQHTRSADVELSYAARRDDPQPKEDRYARALEKLEPTLRDDDPLPRGYLLAGQAYLGLRDYAGADSMLAHLVRAEPECESLAAELRFNAWVPLYNQGINFLRATEQDQALEAFQKANLIYEDARSLTNAANILQQQGENDQAMELYSRALEIGGEPDLVRAASINLAELLRAQGRSDEALAIYSEYAAAHPEDVLGTLQYAVALMDNGDTEAATAMFEELMGREDLSFRQWSQVGIGLYRAQKFDEAAVAFQSAHEINPLNKEIMENLANTYYQAGMYQELLPLAAELVERYPLESVNYNLLANAHTELEDPDAALSVLERRDALAFEFLRSQLSTVSDGVYSIAGQVMNKRAAAGSEVSVAVELLDETGGVVTTDDLLITMPAEGEATAFQLQIESEEAISGFQYGPTATTGP